MVRDRITAAAGVAAVALVLCLAYVWFSHAPAPAPAPAPLHCPEQAVVHRGAASQPAWSHETPSKSSSETVTPETDGQDATLRSRYEHLERLYLDTLRDTLTGVAFRTTERSVGFHTGALDYTKHLQPFNLEARNGGLDWPFIALTMVGTKRLTNVEWAIRHAVASGAQGDFVECGVWRGGSSVFARAVLNVIGERNRLVWLVDSFAGLPKARTGNDVDHWSELSYVSVDYDTVRANLAAFGMLDENTVRFVKGFFVDSLPTAPIDRIAVLRMDGDMYESTMDELFNLYNKVSVGGVIIIDDYAIDVCRRAIQDFFSWHGMTEKIVQIDTVGAYWIKERDVTIQMARYASLKTSTRT
jgi:hypothetical protein